MKKIFSLLAVFVLVFSLTVSAFATDYNGTELPDKPVTTYSYEMVTVNNSGVYRYISSSFPVIYDSGILTVAEYTSSASIYYQCYKLVDGAWGVSNTYKLGDSGFAGSIVWTNHNIYDTSGELYYMKTEILCDGSSCPATDVNIDGFCDDCGRMLGLGSLTYPDFPSVDGSNKHYALVKTKYSGVDAYMYSVFTSDATYDIRGETPSTVYQIAVDGVADYIQYVTTDGKTWVEIQNSSVNNQSVGSGIVSETAVISSTFNWYDGDGEHFFPVPLWVEVEEVTQGEMMGMGQMMGGTLRLLVPCGVGLMACLVVLGLFGKRSLIFRN